MAYRRRLLSGSLLAGGIFLGLVACGSRTGLFAPEDGEIVATKDASAEAGFDATVGCTPGTFTLDLAITQLMFVIDRSGSMAFTLDGAPDQPRSEWRWTLLQDALAQTITSFDNEIAMGAKFFPEEITRDQASVSAAACALDSTIAIPPAVGNAKNILSVFDNTTPLGGTPTSDAITTAAEALAATRSAARTIVLATDGAPNCNGDLDQQTCTCTSAEGTLPCNQSGPTGRYNCLDDTRTISTIQSVYQSQGIPVYVIGIGSLERPDFQNVLDEMAVAGGRPRDTSPKYFDVQSESDLTSALGTIRDSVAKCTYLTPSAPTDPNAITIQINGVSVPRDTNHLNGWDWIDQKFGELAFFGSACTNAQKVTTASSITDTVSCGP